MANNNIKFADKEKEQLPRVTIDAKVIYQIEDKAVEMNMTRSEMWEHALKFYLNAEIFLQNMQMFIKGKQ